MWYLPILLSSQIILSWTLPAPDPFRKNDGVNLNGRKKVHGEGEKCPQENPGYCRCKTRGDGLDITCEDVNSNQLDVSFLPIFRYLNLLLNKPAKLPSVLGLKITIYITNAESSTP